MHNDYIDIYPDTRGPHHHRNDTEAAFVPRPGHECCPSGSKEECVCVTSGDVALWNQVSAISAASAIDWDSLSSVISLTSSADKWNGTYVTVYRNSAAWNSATSAFEDLTELSSYWQDASNIVSVNSAKWNSAAILVSGIQTNKDNIDKLSADLAKQVKIYFSKDSISGTGTINQPYGVNNYTNFINTLNKVNDGYNKLFYPDGTQKWLSLSAESDKDGINPYIKSLFSAVSVKDTDQDKTLIKHGELIQWIIEHLKPGGEAFSGVGWKYMGPTASQEAITSWTGENMVYFTCE